MNEPCWQYRKGESRIFKTRAEIPKGEGWKDHWNEIEDTCTEVIAGNIYDEETLDAIFDQEGIKGLRIIGKHFGVKSKSKEALIKLIMERQNDSE